MTFNEWFNRHVLATFRPHLQDLYDKKCMQLTATTTPEDGPALSFWDLNGPNPSECLKPETTHFIHTLQKSAWRANARYPDTKDMSNTSVQAFLLAGSMLVGQGPKVFRPTAMECEALQHVDIRVPADTYRQPFDCVVVEFPDEYGDKLPIASASHKSDRKCMPRFVIASYRHAHGMSLFGLYSDGTAFMSPMILGERRDIEDIIREQHWQNHVTDEQASVSERVIRVTINACMLATTYGTRQVGSLDPARRSRLRDRLSRSGKNPHDRKIRESLRMIPEVYTFHQHIRLFRVVDEPRPEGASREGGWTIKPHWRRGHWTHQPCGPGNAQRKPTFREGLMVNEWLYKGELVDARLTMTTT